MFTGCISVCSVICNRIFIALKALMNPNKICNCISLISIDISCFYHLIDCFESCLKNFAGPRSDGGFCSAQRWRLVSGDAVCSSSNTLYLLSNQILPVLWIPPVRDSESDSEFCRAQRNAKFERSSTCININHRI